MGEPDYASGVTVQLRIPGQPPVVISISRAELLSLNRDEQQTLPESLLDSLLDSQTLWQWLVKLLAYKLNGREALIDTLLKITDSLAVTSTATSTATSHLSKTTRSAIERQLAIVLEQPDTEFSLEFELQQLGETLRQDFLPGIQSLPRNQRSKSRRQVSRASRGGASSGSARQAGSFSSGGQKRGNSASPTSQPPDKPAVAHAAQAIADDAFEMEINGIRCLLAKNQLSLAARGGEDATTINVDYYVNNTLYTSALSEVEEALGVPYPEQLENTSQRLLPYLFYYGTDDTVSALPGFYGVSICGLSHHHLIIGHCQKARRVAYQCLMCAEANFGQDILVAGCEHYFHPACLAHWLRTTSNSAGRCPQCNAESMNELSYLMNDPKILALELLVASQNDSRQLVEMLLRIGANVNAGDQNGDTPLHWAAWQGDEDRVRQLLAYQPNMQLRDIWGKTAGDLARERSHNAILRLLGEEPVPEPSTGLRVADSPSDIEALQRAVENSQKSNVIELFKKGMDVNQRLENDNTLLHLAVKYGCGEIARLLIDVYELDPKATNKEGSNALHRAALGGHIELVQLLIDHYGTRP